MKFSDLLPRSSRKTVGRIIEADWDATEHGIRFTILFEPSGRKLSAVCKAGALADGSAYVSEIDLRKKVKDFDGLSVYEHAFGGDPNVMKLEDFRKLKIEVSLSNLSVSYRSDSRPLESNTFISRLFK